MMNMELKDVQFGTWETDPSRPRMGPVQGIPGTINLQCDTLILEIAFYDPMGILRAQLLVACIDGVVQADLQKGEDIEYTEPVQRVKLDLLNAV